MLNSHDNDRDDGKLLARPRTVTRRDAFRLLIGAGALTLATPLTALATSESDISSAQAEADAAQEQLDEITSECTTLSEQLSDTAAQVETVSGQVEEKQGEIDEKQGEIDETQQQIDEKQQEIEQKQEVLGKRMAAAYKAGNTSALEILLSSSSFEELTSNIYFLDKISESENEMISEVKSLKSELEAQKTQLEAEKTELEQQKTELEQQKSELESLQATQEEQLAAVQEKQEEASQLVEQLNSEVQDLISQRNAELLAAQAASRSGSGGTASIPSGSSGSQAAVVSAAYSTPSTGVGYCAAWVTNVFRNAGIGSWHGNACDLYWSYCTSSNQADLQTGMIIAVPTEPYSAAAILYGHIGIYIGDGNVRHCIAGVVKTQSLSYWISTFGVTATPRWGWLGGVVLA